jgi:hypothetical protein
LPARLDRDPGAIQHCFEVFFGLAGAIDAPVSSGCRRRQEWSCLALEVKDLSYRPSG